LKQAEFAMRICALWFMAAYNYELDIPYQDFRIWEKDLLAMLSESGL
jgi:hypothetical protein